MTTGASVGERILLTGAGGFVGRRLVPFLQRGFPSAVFKALTSAEAGLDLNVWRPEKVDYSRPDMIAKLVSDFQPTIVVHLAAQSSVAHSQNAALETWDMNFGGTQALVRACAEHCPGSTFFFVSSAEVYGTSFSTGLVDEWSPTQPVSSYGRSKLAAEYFLRDMSDRFSSVIIVRAFNHSGPGQNRRFALPTFAAQIAEIEAGVREPKVVVGDIDVSRDFLHVDDVCDAYITLLRLRHELSGYHIFNVSSGCPRNLRDMLELMRTQSGIDFEIEVDKTRIRGGEVRFAVGSSRLLRDTTDWKPTISMESLVDDLLEAWRKSVAAN